MTEYNEESKSKSKSFDNSGLIAETQITRSETEIFNNDIYVSAGNLYEKRFYTDILDNLENAVINIDPIYFKGTTIVSKVLNDGREYLLKAIRIKSEGKDWPPKIQRLLDEYPTKKALGEECQFFLKAFDCIAFQPNSEHSCFELLTEFGGKSLLQLMDIAAVDEIKVWMIQSVMGINYARIRNVGHFSIKPKNMVYQNKILKFHHLCPPIKTTIKDLIEKSRSPSLSSLPGYSWIYAPPELLTKKPEKEKLDDEKIDVFCWAMSFYQIIKKLTMKEMVEFRKEMAEKGDKFYNEFVLKINEDERLLIFDPKKTISKILCKCLKYKQKDRCSFSDVEKDLEAIESDVFACSESAANILDEHAKSWRKYPRIYDIALKYNEKAIKIREKLNGDKSVQIARLYNNKGNCLDEKGDLKEAFKCHEKALEIYKDHFADNQGEIAVIYSNLGVISLKLGEEKQALDYLENALKIYLSLPTCNEEDVAMTKHNIGGVYEKMKNYSTALGYYKEALVIREQVLGEDSIETGQSYNSVGLILATEENNVEAFKYLERAYEIFKSQLGENHVTTAEAVNNLGLAYYHKGENEKAIKEFEKAYEIYKSNYGDNDLNTATSLSNLGLVYLDSNNAKIALDYFKKALSIRRKILGKESSEIALIYNSIGNAYYALKQYEDAKQSHEKALKIYEVTLGSNNLDYSFTTLSLAQACIKTKCYNDGVKYFVSAVDLQKKLLGQDNKFVAETIIKIADNLLPLGKVKEARKNYEEALGIYLGILGDNPETAVLFSKAAYAAKKGSDYKAAFEYSKKSFEIRKKTSKENDLELIQARYDVGMACFSVEDYENALNEFSEVLAIRQKSLGKNHIDTADSYNSLGMTQVRYAKKEDTMMKKKGLNNHKTSLEIYEKLVGKEHAKTAETYNYIGAAFRSLDNNIKAKQAYEKALSIFEINKDPKVTDSYENLGKLFSDMGDKDKSVEYYKKAVEVEKKQTIKDSVRISALYTSIAKIHESKGEKEKALQNYLYILTCVDEEDSTSENIAKLNENVAKAYFGIGKREEALAHYRIALGIIQKIPGSDTTDILFKIKEIESTNKKKQ